jgi:hypothetical protein
MSEYKHTISKQSPSGFSGSPSQTEANAGNPNLNGELKTKDAIGLGIAYIYGKKAFSTVMKAQVGQMGIAEVERSLESVKQLATYVAIAFVRPGLSALAIGSDIFTSGVDRAVNIHNTNLDNIRTVEERGTRRDMNAGGFYG